MPTFANREDTKVPVKLELPVDRLRRPLLLAEAIGKTELSVAALRHKLTRLINGAGMSSAEQGQEGRRGVLAVCETLVNLAGPEQLAALRTQHARDIGPTDIAQIVVEIALTSRLGHKVADFENNKRKIREPSVVNTEDRRQTRINLTDSDSSSSVELDAAATNFGAYRPVDSARILFQYALDNDHGDKITVLKPTVQFNDAEGKSGSVSVVLQIPPVSAQSNRESHVGLQVEFHTAFARMLEKMLGPDVKVVVPGKYYA